MGSTLASDLSSCFKSYQEEGKYYPIDFCKLFKAGQLELGKCSDSICLNLHAVVIGFVLQLRNESCYSAKWCTSRLDDEPATGYHLSLAYRVELAQ